MTEAAETVTGRAACRRIGLVANPFRRVRMRDGEGIGTSLEIQAAGNRFLAALDALAEEPRSSTLWAERIGGVPTYYHNAALIYLQHELINDDELNLLFAYIQLFTAKVGRVRSALNVLAERLATRSFDETLALLLARIIAEPDEELLAEPEVAEAWAVFREEFEADRAAAVERVLGTFELLKNPAGERPVDTRPISLDTEPEETDDSEETDIFTEALPSPIPEAERTDPVLEYIIAYARNHYSPVVARGLRIYLRDGAGPFADELKITKAPRKTLTTLVDLASLRFRKAVLLYDGFDNWRAMPEELKIKYAASLTEIRLRAGDHAIMAFMIPTGAAPELEDQFSGRNRVEIAFPGVPTLGPQGMVLDRDVVANWLMSATLPGASVPDFDDTRLPGMIEEAGDDLEEFCRMAEGYIDAVAAQGSW